MADLCPIVPDPSLPSDSGQAPQRLPIVCVNGELLPAPEARISVLDHGLLYGDGLFETMRIVAGRCFQLEAHLHRLADAAGRLGLALPWSEAELARALSNTIAANQVTTGALRLTVTRGAGSPIPDPSVCDAPEFFILLRETPQSAAPAAGLRLLLGHEHPRLFVPGIKSLCYLPFQAARAKARAQGWDDALLQYQGQVVETAISNLFVVQSGTVFTPSLESGCLPGITRALVLRLANGTGIDTQERPITVRELNEVDEAFVTNSLQGIVSVAQIGSLKLGESVPGETTNALRVAYTAELERFSGMDDSRDVC